MVAKTKRLFPYYATVILSALLLLLTATLSAVSRNVDTAKEIPPPVSASAQSIKVTWIEQTTVAVVKPLFNQTNIFNRPSAPIYTAANGTAKKEEAPTEDTSYMLDVPLDAEMQKYIHGLCEENNVPYNLVVAIIERESSYRPEVISKTNDYGLMQINVINHETLEKTLGITDFLDPKQNCEAGIYIISGYWNKYGDYHKALMAYNMGETGAGRKWKQGIFTTDYSEGVIEIMNRLEGQKK